VPGKYTELFTKLRDEMSQKGDLTFDPSYERLNLASQSNISGQQARLPKHLSELKGQKASLDLKFDLKMLDAGSINV